MTGADAAWPLQQAIHAALSGDAALMALVTGVFDHVPPGQPFPYLTMGAIGTAAWSGKTFAGGEHALALHAWSCGRGRAEARAILARAAAVLELLDGEGPALGASGHVLVGLRFLGADVVLDEDGATYHGVARFRAVTQEA